MTKKIIISKGELDTLNKGKTVEIVSKKFEDIIELSVDGED